MSKRDDLKAEATDLGLEFKGNISNVKLEALVAEARGDLVPVNEVAPPSPAVKQEVSRKTPVSRRDRIRRMVAEAKKKAFKTSAVTLTNKDNRENDMMTTAYLSFENQYFGLSKYVPLDIPVHLEAALIHIAETTFITLHKDEIVNGARTGNKIPVRTKKFAISYARTA